MLLPLFLGCAGKNTVAGENKTKAEQLEAAVPSWCTTVCQRLSACASSDACDCSGDACSCTNLGGNDCVAECQATMAAFTSGDDNCATIGQSFKSCIDGATCDGLVNANACQLTAAEKRACPKPKSGDDTVDSPPSSGSPGSSTGGSSSSPNAPDGSANVGGGTSASSGTAGSANDGSNDFPTTGVPVSCQNSYGTGGGSPAEPATNGVVLCEEGRSDCTDGHEYSWLCAKNATGEAACSCLVDSGVTGAFDPGSSCPALAQVNAGCHFNLAP
jgi:hypothetical protein